MLYHTATTAPAPLPFRIRLSDGRTRTNPDTFTADEIADAGYIASPAKPDHDPEAERAVWQIELQDWVIEALPPAPEPEPRPLSRLQFEGLVQQAAGLSDAQFLAALDDANLRLMWHRLNIASQVERDHELTQAGLAALVATGHLTDAQVQAIMAAWPTDA